MKARRTPRYAMLAAVTAGILLLAGACSAEAVQEKTEPNGFGMFSWDEAAMSREEKSRLDACIKEAKVSRIYQWISEESLSGKETSDFIKRMNQQSVEVYALLGDAEWSYERTGGSLRYALEQIAGYNKDQKKEAQIPGVMVDVEPYLLDEWDEGSKNRQKLMEKYQAGIKVGYDYAKKNGLDFWVCIPVFYDATNNDILEKLISTSCDGVTIMNYDRTDEYMQIAKEVGYAREYGKDVVCIYELQEAGKHDLKEINTYAGLGLDALWESSERLEKQFGYDRLQFAYHYYNALRDMLE